MELVKENPGSYKSNVLRRTQITEQQERNREISENVDAFDQEENRKQACEEDDDITNVSPMNNISREESSFFNSNSLTATQGAQKEDLVSEEQGKLPTFKGILIKPVSTTLPRQEIDPASNKFLPGYQELKVPEPTSKGVSFTLPSIDRYCPQVD